jgi:hypothetical protein
MTGFGPSTDNNNNLQIDNKLLTLPHILLSHLKISLPLPLLTE